MFKENDHSALVCIVCESKLLRKTYPNVCSTKIILKVGSACDQSYMECNITLNGMEIWDSANSHEVGFCELLGSMNCGPQCPTVFSNGSTKTSVLSIAYDNFRYLKYFQNIQICNHHMPY